MTNRTVAARVLLGVSLACCLGSGGCSGASSVTGVAARPAVSGDSVVSSGVVSPRAVRVLLTPDTVVSYVGDTVRMVARVLMSDSSYMETGGISVVSDTGVDVLVSGDTVIAVARLWGTHPVKVTAVSGMEASGVVAIHMPAAPALRIAISPGAGCGRVGVRVQYSAAGRDSSGHPVDIGTVQWSAKDTTVAVIDQNGVMTTRAPGHTSIVASAMGVAALSQLVVDPAAPGVPMTCQ